MQIIQYLIIIKYDLFIISRISKYGFYINVRFMLFLAQLCATLYIQNATTIFYISIESSALIYMESRKKLAYSLNTTKRQQQCRRERNVNQT